MSSIEPENILETASKAVCDKGDASIKNEWEAIALVCHACMRSTGFTLIGLDEERAIGPDKAALPLPPEWNNSSVYSFQYSHERSSIRYLIKISRLGGNAIINALAHDKTTSFDVQTKSYTSPSAFPIAYSSVSSETLGQAFISQERLKDFISLFNVNVIQKLAPGLQKEGYEEATARIDEGQPSRHPHRPPHWNPLNDLMPDPARPHPLQDPLRVPPRPRPIADFPPPGFEDEFEIHRPSYAPGYGPSHPLSIGERDLYPPGLGPHDPLRGHFGPTSGGGGMHPTFDDPLFGGGGRRRYYDPQVPAGSRYDPVGPEDEPPMGGPHVPGGRSGFGFGGGGLWPGEGFGPGGGIGGGFGGGII